MTVEQNMKDKPKCPRCVMCGKQVRGGRYAGYEDQALCRQCEKSQGSD